MNTRIPRTGHALRKGGAVGGRIGGGRFPSLRGFRLPLLAIVSIAAATWYAKPTEVTINTVNTSPAVVVEPVMPPINIYTTKPVKRAHVMQEAQRMGQHVKTQAFYLSDCEDGARIEVQRPDGSWHSVM